MPVLYDPVKKVLSEILTDDPVIGEFQDEIIDPHMVSFE
jgi:hypothetical protein